MIVGEVWYKGKITKIEIWNLLDQGDTAFFRVKDPESQLLFNGIYYDLTVPTRRPFEGFDLETTDSSFKRCTISVIRRLANYDHVEIRSLKQETSEVIFGSFLSVYSRDVEPILDLEAIELQEIQRELDLWLSSPEEFFERKLRGLVRYL
jgi:hypothetical protein